MTKLRMGIIGLGGIAQERHIPSYLKLKDKVNLTAVYDINNEKANKVAKKFQIPNVETNYQELFSKVDAVTICTPNKFHAEISIAALKSGVHVLCEKPMAMTAVEAKTMIEEAKKANRLLTVAYNYRHTKPVQIAKQVMSNNEIGEPLVIRIKALRRRKVPGWGVFINKELQGGGSLIDHGCHFLDIALWLLNNPKPLEVIGTSYNHLSRTSSELNEWGTFDTEKFNVDDHVSAYIRFEKNISMLFECSWAANIKEDETHLSISGTEGGLNLYPFEIYKPNYGLYMTNTTDIENNVEESGLLQAKNFVESCLNQSSLVVKANEAKNITQLIDAIYESSKMGKTIQFE